MEIHLFYFVINCKIAKVPIELNKCVIRRRYLSKSVVKTNQTYTFLRSAVAYTFIQYTGVYRLAI